ncbi:MAG: radical SAM protein [Phycisphaerae bacterium]|nr:radical SAM protein [Phycisphaerae bacterium]
MQQAKEVLSEPTNKDQSIIDATQVSQPSGPLRLLFWESTIKCNLACAHCRRLESNESAGKDMSTKQAKDLIEQLAQLGRSQSTMPILVFSGGEPFCRDDIFELVGYADSLGLGCALATNGTLIDDKLAQWIKDSCIARVAISLDGATTDVHNKLRKQDGSFEKALEGAKLLSQMGVHFQINITLTKQNAHQLEEVYQLAKSIGAAALHIFMLVPVGCGQTLAETDMLTPRQYEEKLLEICGLDAIGGLQVKVTCGPHYERILRQQGLRKTHSQTEQNSSSVPGRAGHTMSSRGCLAGNGVLFVGHQGDVFPCGYLPVKCGNVIKERLADIIRSNKDLARMRDSEALEGKCGYCECRKICGGCRARAYAQTGNYMAEEPFCAYIPASALQQSGEYDLKR